MTNLIDRDTAQRRVVVPAPRIDGSQEAGTPAEPASGARALHQALDDVLGKARSTEPEHANDRPADDAAAGDRRLRRPNVRRGLKIAAALAVVVVFGIRPLQSLLQAASVEAVVNGRIVTLRAPIEGDVIATPSDFTAWSATKGAPVLRIRNENADRTRLDDLRRQIGKLDDERPGLLTRLERARDTLNTLEGQIAAFTQGRIRQLESRCAALESDAAGTAARAEEAQAAYDRIATLAARGVAANAELARYNRDNLAAAAADKAASQRLQEAKYELEAARSGSFLGDSYNDRPGSAQRADDVRLRINDIVADLQARDAQRTRLATELIDETARFERLAETDVTLPVSGRMWEILISPGERVRRDQDLIRVLDCSSAVVTANVEENVYNQLRVGGPARFRPSDGGPDVPGSIVNLTGMAGVTGNLGIKSLLSPKQAYHVTVSVPAIAQAGSCEIGRTGRVYFDGGTAVAQPLDFGLRR